MTQDSIPGGEEVGMGPATATCAICHRTLTDPDSIKLGVGPICAAKKQAKAWERGITDRFIDDIPIRDKVVLRRGQDEGAPYHRYIETNVPLAINLAGCGYEWGYGGAGPATLALNIMEIAVAHLVDGADHKAVQLYGKERCSNEAWTLHQAFKSEVIAAIPHEGGEIPWNHVERFVRSRLDESRSLGGASVVR